MKAAYIALLALLALASSGVFAYDPSPLQDFCVAINDTKTGGMYIYSTLISLSPHFIIFIYIYIYI